MTSTKIRFLMIAALLSALAALPMVAHSALVGSGSIATPTDVIGAGYWTDGVSLDWSVADAGDKYLYSYTFKTPYDPGPGLDHFILQTSDTFTTGNIKLTSNYNYVLDTFAVNLGGEVEGSLTGIKFQDIGGNAVPWMLVLGSDRAPMPGDFYAYGEGGGSYAYNSGFGDREGVKIMVPDLVDKLIERIPVPEAGALLLFGSGLMSIAVWGRRRRRMQN